MAASSSIDHAKQFCLNLNLLTSERPDEAGEQQSPIDSEENDATEECGEDDEPDVPS